MIKTYNSRLLLKIWKPTEEEDPSWWSNERLSPVKEFSPHSFIYWLNLLPILSYIDWISAASVGKVRTYFLCGRTTWSISSVQMFFYVKNNAIECRYQLPFERVMWLCDYLKELCDIMWLRKSYVIMLMSYVIMIWKKKRNLNGD